MRYLRANVFYNFVHHAYVSVPDPFFLLLGLNVLCSYNCLKPRRLGKHSYLYIECNWKHQTLC